MGRAIVTYNAPGTWLVDDADVQYDQFKATVGQPKEVSDPRIVPHFEDVAYRPPPNAAVIMKGSLWPGIMGVKNHEGLTHKSPNMETDAQGNPLQKRLLLKVDLAPSDTQPGLKFIAKPDPEGAKLPLSDPRMFIEMSD